MRLDLDVDAYVPAEYVPFEAAKIDVHRRVSAAREPGELRELADELRDRFGPLPEPLENLIALQRARIEFGRAGAGSVEVRGGRLTVVAARARLRAVGGGLRAGRGRDLRMAAALALGAGARGGPAARLGAAVALAEALAALRSEPVAAPPPRSRPARSLESALSRMGMLPRS